MTTLILSIAGHVTYPRTLAQAFTYIDVATRLDPGVLITLSRRTF